MQNRFTIEATFDSVFAELFLKMSSIDEIKSRIDIVDLASEAGVKLRRSGKTYTGFCPFHQNTRTPAFVIWPETGTWRCFGECNDGGDIFKFVMKKEGLDFKEVLHRLAERAGVQLEQFSPEKQEQREENQRLRNLLEDAVNFYRNALFNTPEGQPALDYLLEKRKLTRESLETFGLGYAPAGWDNALKYFSTKNYTEQDLLDVGLLSERDSGGYYDRFRNRIMIPIRDENGRMTGFGARILDPNDQPKFLNSPQTVLFDKGRLLYGLDRARKPIRAADQAVIVEGYLDVIALHQAKYENVVSPMGTALTEHQMRLLKRFTRKIVLALDPDAAGQKAVLRGLDAARASMDREQELRFDARGLLRHEARLQADLRVAALPDGLDPDEVVERDREAWGNLIAAAKPVVEHVLDSLLADRDVNDAKVKVEIVGQVLPLIEDLPSPVERDSYRQMLARRLRVDERSLVGRAATGHPLRRGTRRRAESSSRTEAPEVALTLHPSREVGTYCLAVLLKYPALLHRLDRRLQQAGLNALLNEDFEYTDHQVVFGLIRESQEQDAAETQRYVEAHLPHDLEGLYQELSARHVEQPLLDKLLDELFRQVIRLRRIILSESINQLFFMQQEAQRDGDPLARTYVELVSQYRMMLQHLHLASSSRD